MDQQQSLQTQATQRHCTIQGHGEQPVLLRCTYRDCKSPIQWMCVGCINLHHDHIRDCLQINQFSEMVQGDKGKYIFKERKELVHEVLQQFHQLKDLILSSLQKLEQQYKDWFTFLKQEETSIQEVYSRADGLNILALTELDITSLLKLNKQQEVEDFQKYQAEAFKWIKIFNADIQLIEQQLAKIIGKQVIVKEMFGEQGFTFVGEYRFGRKFGEWSILDTCSQRIGGGSYNEVGKKHGQWIDIDQIQKSIWGDYYYSQQIGKYQDGTRIDQWVIKDKQGKQIGGGQYNASGSKVGQWIDIEVSGGYYYQHIGKYQDGTRIDQWVIKDKQGKQIGGGQYNASGSKVGQWIDIEVSGGYYYQHIGKYQDGTRIDQWVIKDEQGKQIGGGQYNASGSKVGQWIDIEVSGGYYYQHIGKYQDGTRIDQWVIKDKQGKQIGGGQYNASGSKVGQWIDIEVSGGYYYQHIGKYQDGTRIDQWVIKDKQGKQIGGGQYNASGSKVGQWIDFEVSGGYYYYQQIGKYQDGTRIDQWVIKDKQGEQIGGGQYNASGSKVGQWIDIEMSGFNYYYQQIGKYQDGTRIDQWVIKDEQGKQINVVVYNQ